MDLKYSAEHESFRAEVREFLKGWPLQGDEAALPLDEQERIFRKRGIEAGYVYRSVPKQYGGSEQPRDAIKDQIIVEEYYVAGAPRDLTTQGAGMLVPTLLEFGTEEQKARYIPPALTGEENWCQGYSEPGSGSDLASLQCQARLEGDEWVINGRKIWVSNVPKADFVILMAVTDPEKGARGGITAFIVDKGTPGFNIEREIPMLGGSRTYELVIDDLRMKDSQVLGEVGQGFAPMQKRLTVRRLEMGAMCVGMAERALKMMCEHTQQRETFGTKLSDRQAIQWWIADAATKIHATRLMVLDAAEKQDRGEDVRTEASMIKVFATEMATEVLDNAMQSFGAMGMTRELPFAIMSQRLRLARIYEGPTEVHRMVIARRTLKKFA